MKSGFPNFQNSRKFDNRDLTFPRGPDCIAKQPDDFAQTLFPAEINGRKAGLGKRTITIGFPVVAADQVIFPRTLVSVFPGELPF